MVDLTITRTVDFTITLAIHTAIWFALGFGAGRTKHAGNVIAKVKAVVAYVRSKV